MLETPDAIRSDMASVAAIIADEERLRAFVAENGDIVRDEDAARDYLSGILAGLADVLCDRTIPHEEVVRRSEERRRRVRLDAAE